MKKYQIVYKTIISQIEEGLYQKNKKLPSEKALAAELNVSVNTIRKALSLLIESGYINSRHGSGYYVNNFDNFNILKLKSLASTYSKRNIKSKILEFKLTQATALQAGLLNVQVGEAIYYIHRLRIVDSKPSILEKTYLVAKYFPGLNKEIFTDSFYNYIDLHTPYKIDRAIKDISTCLPNKHVQNQLLVKANHPLLVIENYVYFTNGEQYEYSYNIHIDEKFSLPITVS